MLDLLLPGCLVLVVVLYALYKKGDVTVSISILRKFFEFTLTTYDRRSPRARPDDPGP